MRSGVPIPGSGDGISYRFCSRRGQDSSQLVGAPDRRIGIPDDGWQAEIPRDARWRQFLHLAGVWEPAMADWPLCYRIVTVAANPEVALTRNATVPSFTGAR